MRFPVRVRKYFHKWRLCFLHWLPKRPLREYGMQEAEITAFTDSVIKTQQRLLTNSAVPLSKEDIQDIYQALY